MIRKANYDDKLKVSTIYEELLIYEQRNGTTSNWKLNIYPTITTAQKGYENNNLYVLEENFENKAEICSSIILNKEQSPEYKSINWKFSAKDKEVLVIHTLCTPPSKAGKGYGKRMIQFAIKLAMEHKCKVIRLDTWAENEPAIKLYKKMGFEIAGYADFNLAGLIKEKQVFFEMILKR